MKKKLLLFGCLATALTSTAKNGITWEGPYEPVETYASGCAKETFPLDYPRPLGECPITKIDTIIVSNQSEDTNECAHYVFDKEYYIVAQDSCGNADTLHLGTERYGLHPDLPIDYNGEKPIYYYNTPVLIGDSITEHPVYGGNCTFLMPEIDFKIVASKCGGYNGYIKKEQSIKAGEELTPGRHKVTLSISDACVTFGELTVFVDVPNRKDIVNITAADTSAVTAYETANLASPNVRYAQGSYWAKDWDNTWTKVASTILIDTYRGVISEDSLISSYNDKTYGDKFASLTPQERLNILTLKDTKESGRYAFVAMDTVSGCSDTAYSYVRVIEPEGIYWIEKSEPYTREFNSCDYSIHFTDLMPKDTSIDYLPIDMVKPKNTFMAKSSCSDVLHYYFQVNNQDPSEAACGHYNYDVNYYVAAKDSCGNSDTLLIGTDHITSKLPEYYNTPISKAPEYLGGCEFAIPDLSKHPFLDFSDSCTANFRLIQTIAPGTRITEETYVPVYFADACHDSVFAYNVEIPVNKEEIVKFYAFDTATVKAGASFLEEKNILATFKAHGSLWLTDWDGAAYKVASTIDMNIYKEDGTKVEHPYILNGVEDAGFYTAIATDTISGCSDTITAYIVVDTLHASSPVIAADLNDTKVDIYTPSGILLKKNVYFKDVMDELKAGIYIVNNKKYYLKK